MALLDEVASRLSSQGVASSSGEDGFYLVRGWLPDSTALPDQMMAVIQTGGQAADAAVEIDRPGLQVLTRGQSLQTTSSAYQEAEAKAQAAKSALHAITPGSLDGRHYVGIWATQDPFFMGYDSEYRPLFSENFILQRSRT
jgi:hypothetical protein